MSSAQSPGVVVVGSANMDLVFTVDRMPRPGETVLSQTAGRGAGGKGLNQAVSAARSGAPTQFVGALGSDRFGDELMAELDSSGVGRERVRRTEGDSGQAVILVDSSAENLIVVSSGANAELTELDPAELVAISAAKVLLMQLELPVRAVIQAARAGREAGAVVILNAAPAAPLAAELSGLIDVLIVNEHEACVIAGLNDVAEASRVLATTVPTLIVTLGADGSSVHRSGAWVETVPAMRVTPVDTTGAGDTYCGAFAAAVAEGRTTVEAVRFATAAAALSVQAVGAVPSIPWRSDVDDFMEVQR